MPLFFKELSENSKKRKVFFHRLLEWILFLLLLVTLFVFVGRGLCRVALSQIAAITNTNIKVDSVNFKLRGVVLIKGLVIRPVSPQTYDDTILRAEKVYAGFKFTSLLKFKPQLKKIRVSNFVVDVQRDLNTNKWNLSHLNIITPKGKGGAIPLIRLKGGVIRYSKVLDNQVRVAAEIPVDMDLRNAEDPNNGYDFSITTASSGGKIRDNLEGYWKPGRFVISGGITSSDIPSLEKVWNIGLISAQADYNKEGDYSFKLRIKDLSSRENFAGDTFGFNKSEVIKRQDSFVALQDFLDEFHPKGTVDIKFDANGNLNKLGESDFSGRLYCKDVSIIRSSFPYLVENINGGIDFTREKVVLNNLAGNHGKVKLFFNGGAEGFGENRRYNFEITSRNMALDKDLYNALTDRQRKMWDQFLPTGLAAINYSMTRQSGTDKKTVLKVEMLNSQARYAVFTYPLKNIVGTLLFEKNDIILSDLVSKDEGHTIKVDGKISGFKTGGPLFDVRVRAEDVPVDSVLRESFSREDNPLWVRLRQLSEYANGLVWLDGRVWSSSDLNNPFFDMTLGIKGMELNENLYGLLPEAARKSMAELEPKGEVDVITGMSHLEGEGIKEGEIKIKCKGNNANLGRLPYSLKDVTGELIVSDKNIVLDGVESSLVSGIKFDQNLPKLKIDGKIFFEKGVFERGQFAVYVGNLPLDEQLGSILTKDVGKIYSGLSPTGLIDANLHNVNVSKSKNGNREYDFDGVFKFKDSSIQIKPALTSIYSDLKIRGCYDANEGLKDVYGNIIESRLKIKGKSLTNLSADLRYDSNSKELFLKNAAGDFYGGVLSGNLDVSEIHRPHYSLQVGFEDVNVAEFMMDVNSSRVITGQRTTGRMSGSFGVSGKAGDSNSNIGRCKLMITDMQVGKLSPIAKLLTVIQLTGTKDFAFSQMYVDSYIEGNGVIFDKFDLAGEGLAFNGSGRMDLSDYNLDLSLMARGKRVATAEPGVLQSLGEGLGYGVVRLEVKGNAYNPDVKTVTLPVLKKTLEIIGTREKN